MATTWQDKGRDWFTPKHPWPADLRFQDCPTERVLDQQMPPRPAQVGDYGSTGRQCLDSPFAGIDL
jgi:hypothetical protein